MLPPDYQKVSGSNLARSQSTRNLSGIKGRKKRLPRNLHSLGYYCSPNLFIDDAFGGVIAIERIFGALKRKFVKDGGYGCIDCQISKRGIQILGIFFCQRNFNNKTCVHRMLFAQWKKRSKVLSF